MNVSLRTTACLTSNTTTSNNNNTSAFKAVPSLLRWFFVFMMLGATSVSAQQLSNYAFTHSNTASLTDMSSGTSVLLATGTYRDTEASAVTGIGFTFNFNNVNYTQFSINSNGQMRLGSTAIGGGTTSPALNAAILAPMGGDNAMQTNGVVHYKVTGSSPNQVLIVEWNSLRIPFSSTLATGSTIQVRLYESTNVVEYVYGTVHNNSTSAASRPIFIAASSDATNVGYITVGATPTITWQSTTLNNSFAASSAVANLSSTTDGSRWMYTFTPPGPCVAPTAQPTGLTLTPSGLSVLNGSFTAAAPPPSGYLVVRTTTNVAPAPVDGTSYSVGSGALGYVESFGTATSWTSTGLLSNTTYYYWVFSYNYTACSGGPKYLQTAPLSGSQLTGACSINGTKSIGTGGDYLNLTQAVAALVNNGVSGHVILELNAGYPGAGETFPINLGAVPCMDVNNTVTIRLAAGAGTKTISTSDSIAIFNINGGQYWRIDGRQGGTGSTRDLTIINTRTATTTAGGAAIRFINDASNNIVRYTNLQSAYNSTTSGVVNFSTTTGANGNDNNTLDNNSINGGAAAAAAPTTGVAQNGIYSAGTTAAAQNNSGNIISNNLISNCWINGSTNTGIRLGAGNTDWTISGNSIYQTNTRTTSTSTTYYGIFIDNSSGNNFTISGNFIGGTAASASGTWTFGGTVANRMTAIGLIVGTTTASSIQGNTITGINFLTSSGATTITASSALAGTWGGIIVAAGSSNIGNVTPNVVGLTTGTGAITVSSSTSLGVAMGIGVLGTGSHTISGNTVAGMTTVGTTASIAHMLIGIWDATSTGAINVINANTIGSATVANSMRANNAFTGTSAQYINGIRKSSTSTASITNNYIANLSNAATPSSSTGSQLRGINIESGVATVEGNTIHDLSVAANATSVSVQAVIGIFNGSSTAGTWSISNNTIYNLFNNHATSTTYITGIYSDGPSAGGTVANNKIYSLGGNATNANATLTGIWTSWGDVPYSNNTIRLGMSNWIGAINGILDSSGTSNFPKWYHNTVYIGGSAVSGSASTYALKSLQATNAHIYQNNIFINARSNSGGTGKHYAVTVPGTAPNPTGLTMDYNIYRATGTGGVFGRFNGADVADLATWRTNVGQDVNSKDLDPCLANPTAATPDMHLTNCATLGSPADGGGLLIATVTTDMDGQTRSSLSPVDIGADAGDYGPAGVDVGVLALVRPTATSCHSAAEDVIVTLKNFSTSVHDFTVNPVTITTNVTGQITAGPLTVTINSGTLAAGASQNVTVGTVDMVTNGNGTYTFTSTASATGDVTPGNDGNVTNVTVNYTALSVTASAAPATICLSGSSKLTAVPAGGTAPYTFLWDAGTDTDSIINNTGTITTTTTYNVTVTDACGVTATNSVTVIVNSPTITGTTPGTRCGTGTVQLSATASPGGATIKWYDSPSGGQAIATGATFTTPVINTTTPYYVSASDGGGTASVGAPNNGQTTGYTLEAGLFFTATVPFTIQSVYIYPVGTGSGTVEIALTNPSGTIIQTTTVNATGTTAPGIKTLVPLNFAVPAAGVDYHLSMKTISGGVTSLTRDGSADITGGGYPFTVPGVMSITAGRCCPSSSSTSYYYFYDWVVTTGCESARTAVTATVTTPPAITATATPTAVCAGQSASLNVTSSNDPDYSYNWTPGPLIGASHTVTPSATTVYTVTAVDSSAGPNTGCATSATVTVTVNPVPGAVVISPSPAVACENGGVTLTATSYGAAATVQLGSGTSASTTNTPYKGFWGGNKTQNLYTAAELEGLGFTAGSKITSIGLNATAHTGPYTFNGFTIKMKHTASTAMTATMESGLSTVFGPTALTINQTAPFTTSHTLATPFIWDGTSNVLVEFCFNNNDGGGVSANSVTVQYTSVTGGSTYRNIDNNLGVCDSLAGATTSALRPNLVLGYQNPAAITWSPATGLSATNEMTVVANPATPTLYTATANLGPCSSSNTVQVNVSDLDVTASGTDISCFGGNNGTITATATGGTAPYQYSINGTTYQASGTFTGLTAGTYTVYAKDANAPNNCVVTTSVTLNQPAAAVTVTATGVDPVCHNGTDGSVINVVGAGGVGGYTYTITGGSFTGLASGTYTITATDANGCTGTVDVTLNNPALPTLTATNSSPVCAGTDVVLTATSGYTTYSWTGPGTINNANTNVATAVAPANGDVFTVAITDANGCTNTATTTVTVNPNLPVSVAVSVAPSTEVCSGTMVTFTATPTNGGTSPTYQWYVNGNPQAGETNPTYAVNTLNDQDVVTVVMTSNETCTSGNPATSDPVTITITGAISAGVTIAPVAPSVCVGQPITITATGTGTGNFPVYDFYVNNAIAQSGSSNTYTYTPADQDQVYVIMTSSYSCATNNPAVSNFETISVYPYPAQPTVTADGPTTFCQGGSVTLTSSAVGGNLWSPGNETTDAIVVTASGSYTVTQTVNGCTSPASDPVVVTVNTATATITPSGPITACSNVEVTFTASAVPAAVSYLWSPGGQTTDTIKTAIAGTYTVTTTDANGCTATASVTVTTNTAPTVSISGASVICTGLTETLTANATAGTGNITGYQWKLNGSNISGATSTTYVATINGNYTVVVTDDLGCSTESAIHVLGLNGPMVGTYTVSSAPASCTNYNTLALAVYDLNNRGLAGNVIIDVAPGHTETAPSGGIVLNQCALTAGLESSASQTITIKKASAGTNPLITAPTGTGTQDAIFANLGTDYVTIDGIDLTENVANTDSVMKVEFGYLLTNCGDNGVKNNLLQNNTITLDKNNRNPSVGIYQINTGTITTTAGVSSNNKYYSNTISNVLSGIRVEGFNDPNEPYALYGQDNEIGAVGQGNNITNFGNSVKNFESYGIRTSRQNNVLVVGNTLNSTTGLNIGLVNGIAVRDSRWANSTISNNTVTIVSGSNTTSQVVVINNNSGSRFARVDAANNTVNITNNTIQNSSYPSAGSGDLWLIGNFKPGADSLGAKNLNITGNQLLNNTNSSSSSSTHFYNIITQVGIDNLNVSNNTITGNSTASAGGSGRSTTGIEAGFAQPVAGMTVQSITISGNTIANNSTASNTGSYTGINTTLFGSAPLAGSSLTISNNNVNNITASAQTTGAMTGITTAASTNIGITMTGNTVSNITRPSTLTTGAFSGIRATGSAFTSIVFDNNSVHTISQPNGTTGTWTVMEAAGSSTSTLTKSVSNNTINNLTFTTTTGTSYMIDAGLAVTSTVSNNSITNVTRNMTSGTLYNIWTSTANNISVTGNTINSVQLANTSGTSSSIIYGIYNGGSPVNETYNNNTISNLSSTGTGTSTSSLVRGIYSASLSTSVKEISGNIIHSFSTTVPASVEGITSTVGISDIHKNKIYNLSTSSTSGSTAVYGISVTGGTTTEVYNNIIGDLRATAASATDPVRGISITQTTSTSTVGLYFNSIYLNGTSTGTNFGNTGIYTSTSTTATSAALDMRNNLVYNVSTAKGTGRVVAYRRSSTTLTNMTSATNNNLYYVSTAANHHIFTDGTNHLSTLAAYKALSGLAPRESNSVTENVSFQSTTPSSADFLKVSTATPTLVEGGGQAISGITTDYFGTTRAGVGPDIGAHEDNFQNIALVITSLSQSPSAVQCSAVPHTVTAVLDEGAAPIVSVTLNYSFNGVAQTPVTMTTSGGGIYTGVIPAATPVNATVTWSVTATDGTYSPSQTGTPYQDDPLDGMSFTISADPTSVCSGSPATLTANSVGTALSGTGSTTSATYSNPFYSAWSNSHNQHLVLASELQAAGLVAGDITALGINVTSAGTLPMIDFSLKIAHTTATDMTNYVSPTFSTVYTNASLLPTTGVNTLTFSTPFTWDGTSNIVIETCHGNPSSTSTMSRTAVMDATSYVSSIHTHVTSGTAANVICGDITTNKTTYSVRPQFTFTGIKGLPGFTINWYDASNTLVATGSTVTVNPLSTTDYHAVATDNITGCTMPSDTTTVSVIPLTADSIQVSATVCSNGFSLTAHTIGGGAPYSYSWSDGSATVYPNAQTINPVLAPGTYTFTVTVTDGCGGNVVMNETVTVNGLPTVTVVSDPSNGRVCGTAATLTASGAVSYTWAPASGLSSTTGAVVQALPTDTTTYTVTGTDANGCTNTATIELITEANITMSATGTPTTLCAGGNVQLSSTVAIPFAERYSFASSSSVALADTTGSTIIIAADVDDTPMCVVEGGTTNSGSIPIGFTFQFEGLDYTHFSASPDGWLHLKNSTATASSDFSNDLASTDNDPLIAAFWDDFNTGDVTAGKGYVKALVSGIAPNRTLVVHWYVRAPRDLALAANSNFQAILYEGTNKIELRYDAINGTTHTASVGLGSLSNLGQYFSVTTSNNTVSTSTVNNSNAVPPAAGTMYEFTPVAPNYAYSWSPTANLNDATISNPLASNLQSSVNYVLTVTRPSTGCMVKDTVVVTVNPLPAATFTGLAATYCSSASAVTLTGTPANGTFSGPGISGNVFSPSAAGPGVHTISYSVTDISTGCTNSTSQQVTVQGPTVSFTGLAGPYCTNAASVTLTGNQAPSGTFSGPGITDNADGTATFNPATAGAGTHNITYSYTDINGCSASDVQSVTVNATTSLAFNGLAATYCDNSATATLTSNQTSGTFSGPGITDNGNGTATFNPATAGQGTHTITFTFTNGSGCTSTTSQQTTVGAGATVSFSGLAASYCYDVENVVTLTGSPAGGTFSGNGISGNTFTPSVVGTYDITYTYNNGSCNTTATQSVTVNALPTVSFSGLAGPYCANAAAVTLTGSPAGGTFSGPGTSGNTFDPAVAGAGTWTIIYNYTDGNGCSNSAEQQVTVNALPVVSISGLAATYCTTDAAVTLTGSPVGGTFSGPGMTGNSFDPAAAGVGTHTITYTYTDGNGCTATATQQVVVQVCTPTNITLNVKVFLEGFYNGSTMPATLFDLGMETDPTATDYIEVNLWDPADLSSPTPHFTQTVIVHTDGTAAITFPSTVNGNSYYIAIKHRNSIETWCAAPVLFSSTTNYDFTTGLGQAYGDGFNNPMKHMGGGVYAFYSGDVNQDGTVDGTDMNFIDNDAAVGAFGFNPSDVTGDGATDGLDMNFVDNNSQLGLFYARPF